MYGTYLEVPRLPTNTDHKAVARVKGGIDMYNSALRAPKTYNRLFIYCPSLRFESALFREDFDSVLGLVRLASISLSRESRGSKVLHTE